MKKTLVLTMLIISVAALLAGCGGDDEGSASITVAESPFAMHEVRLVNSAINESDAMHDIGAHTARISPYGSLIWDVIEGPTGTYDWSASDAVISAGNAAGIDLLVGVKAQNRLDGTPPGSGQLPGNMDRYLQFLRSAIERYDGDAGATDAPGSPKINVVQIENELDGVFWRDTPENYALLLKKSYQTIKQVAPDIKVAIGGVATPRGFYSFYKWVLAELDRIKDNPGDRYFDIFDFHWSGQFEGDDDYDVITLPTGTYELRSYELRSFVADVRGELNKIGYTGVPLYITEMSDYSDTPEEYSYHSERYHAAAVIKRYVYALTAGIDKIFWSQIFESHNTGGMVNGYFDNVGLINNPLNTGGHSHKKLAYYSYKKMAEMLSGSDWKNIETIRETGDVHIYKFMKNGKPVYAAWWDYSKDASYTPGKTIDVSISGLTGSVVSVTECLPRFNTGADVADYESAFRRTAVAITDGAAVITLGDSPVFIEPLSLSLSLVKTVTLTTDAEGGSARPEIIATDNRVFAVYLGHIPGGRTTKTFDVKVYDADLSSLITHTTIVPPTPAYGAGTDIRIARDGNHMYAFYETSTTDRTFLHGAKYALKDSFDLVARATAITDSKPVFEMTEGDEVLNDPAPLVGPNSVFVVTRLWSSITRMGSTVYRVREFRKADLYELRQFDLDLSAIADGRGRVASLLYADGSIYMALATTVSDEGASDANKFSDDGAQCDIIVVKMAPDWSFDPSADVKTVSKEPGDRENYITGLRTDGRLFSMTYKQAVGGPPTGEQRAVIKIFDRNFNLLHKEIVKSIAWGGGEIRPSLEIFGNTIYSGQDNSPGIGAGNSQVYIYEIE